MSKYPEHEKLKTCSREVSVINSFIDFLLEQQWEIAEYDEVSERLFTIRQRPDEIIALFLNVDLKKLEKEKQAMLAEIRKLNAEQEKGTRA